MIKGIDTVVQHFEEMSYESYKGEKEVKRETFPALAWEARRDTSWSPVRNYVYDGVNMVADSGQLDSNWNQYAFLGYKRLAWVSQDSGLRVPYIGSDHLGTANLLMDNAGGILSRYVLDPWGNVEYAKETVPQWYLYTDKEIDAEADGMVTYWSVTFCRTECC